MRRPGRACGGRIRARIAGLTLLQRSNLIQSRSGQRTLVRRQPFSCWSRRSEHVQADFRMLALLWLGCWPGDVRPGVGAARFQSPQHAGSRAAGSSSGAILGEGRGARLRRADRVDLGRNCSGRSGGPRQFARPHRQSLPQVGQRSDDRGADSLAALVGLGPSVLSLVNALSGRRTAASRLTSPAGAAEWLFLTALPLLCRKWRRPTDALLQSRCPRAIVPLHCWRYIGQRNFFFGSITLE